MKKLTLLMSGLLVATSSFAQETTAATSFSADPINHPMFPAYVVLSLLITTILLAVFVCIYALRVMNVLTEHVRQEKAHRLGIPYVPAQGWWSKFTQKINASVPVEQEKDIEMDHSYDGIKELDNHLPPWWKWLFYGTIGWAAVYIVVFHFTNSLPLSQEEYHNEIALAEDQARIRKANLPAGEEIDETKLEFKNDPAIIEKGKNVFANNPCSSCHRADGGGNTIGPNLTDEYWLHGGDVKSIFSTIKNGVIEKGMPSWNKSLSPQDIRDVSFYILSLQGSNPANAKSPQGELVKRQPALADSTKAQASL